MADRAPLIVTLGDPSGVGPELVCQAWRALGRDIPFAAIGDAAALKAISGDVPVRVIASLEDLSPDALCLLDIPCPEPVRTGHAQPRNAQAVVDSISHAVGVCASGAASGLVTAPINKAVLVDGAGFAYPGHTEFLAALDGKERSVMMLAGPDLRVVPVTIHCALKDVPGLLTEALLEDTIRITHRALQRDFGLPDPVIAVAGLNPHAGENGLMGHEDTDLIAPVLVRLRAGGLRLLGPMSADTMFHSRAREGYDCAICMYHDQALIPIKTLAFDDGVNVTLGLDFVRTSPDHGTAFDIAGKGQARPDSMIAAIRMADQIAAHRA